MRRAFHQSVLPLWPNVIFILGDYFDGGPYLSDEEWNESLIRPRHFFSLRVRDRYLNILVYYLPGNHEIGYVLHSPDLRSANGQEVMQVFWTTEIIKLHYLASLVGGSQGFSTILQVSILLCPSSGVSVWHHCSDLMGIVKQVISSIRSRTKEKIEDLNCVYEMIWDAEGSMHLVKKAIGTSIARSIERNSVERGNAVLQSAARKNISQHIEVSVNGDAADADSVVDPLAKLLPRASRSRKKTVTGRLVQTLLMVMIIAAVNVPLYVMLPFKD